MPISELNRTQLVNEAQKTGWKQALNMLIASTSPKQSDALLIETRFLYTAWMGLVDLSQVQTAIVFDIGLGGNVIALAQRVEKVYAFCLDTNTEDLLRIRLGYFGLNNVEIISNDSLNEDFSLTSCELLVNIDDGTFKRQNKIVQELLRSHQDVKQIHFNSASRAIHNKVENFTKFYVTGRIRSPFQLVSEEVKKESLGWVRYLFFRMMARSNKGLTIATNWCIDNSMFQKIVFEVSRRLGTPIASIDLVYFVKPFGALLQIESSTGNYMLRIAFDELAENRYKAAAEVMQRLEKISPLIPKVFLSGKYQNHYYQLESCFGGKNISKRHLETRTGSEQINIQAYELLSTFQRVDREIYFVDLTFYTKYIGSLFNRVKSYFSIQHRASIDIIENYVQPQMIGLSLSLVVSHGDYSIDNLLIKGSKISGIIDWEFSCLKGLPLLDLLFYIVSVRKKKRKSTIVESMHDMFCESDFKKDELALVGKYCEEFKLPTKLIRPFVLIMIMNFLSSRLDIKDEVDRHTIFDRKYSLLITSLKNNIESFK